MIPPILNKPRVGARCNALLPFCIRRASSSLGLKQLHSIFVKLPQAVCQGRGEAKPFCRPRVFHIATLMLVISMLLDEMGMANTSVPELIADRPDQTESSSVILPGYVQAETGILYTEEDEGDERSRTLELPRTLFRIGLVDRVEFRLGFDGWVSEDVEDKDGFGDSEVGFKFYLWKEAGILPETTLLTSLSLPTGADEFTNERADPRFRFLFSHTLTDRITLSYNLGMAWGTEEDERGERDTLSVFEYTFSAGFGLTDRLGAFAELFGNVLINAEGGPAHSFDGGFTYLVKSNVQLDVSSGVGLSNSADDWFVSAGFTYSFPR